MWPVEGYPVMEVNDNSARLITEHKTAFPNQFTIKQVGPVIIYVVEECGYKRMIHSQVLYIGIYKHYGRDKNDIIILYSVLLSTNKIYY